MSQKTYSGSRQCMLRVTGVPRDEFLEWVNSLVFPYAEVRDDDLYTPRGFSDSREARLGETPGFLTEKQREIVTSWWLKVPKRANTPNWDLACTCRIGDRQGLLLVEAKGHEGELKEKDCCKSTNELNLQSIHSAIDDANHALGAGWSLSGKSHFQLGNRFAWAWKIASLGVPVVLVYLGFLNVYERGTPFRDQAHWERRLLAHAAGRVPNEVWNGRPVSVNGTPLIALIRTADIKP